MNPNFLFLNEETLPSSSLVVSTPSTSILPEVGLSSKPIMLSSVDFPEPELPTIRTNSPFSTEKSTL